MPVTGEGVSAVCRFTGGGEGCGRGRQKCVNVRVKKRERGCGGGWRFRTFLLILRNKCKAA